MKILFLGDYSNLHACIAAELRRRGHYVNVVSDKGKYMDTHSDTHLFRTPRFTGGIKYIYRLMNFLPEWKGYDMVQLINPNFLHLRPGKIKYFFDRIREQNGSMFLTLASNDYFFVKACYDASLFRFSEFKIGKNPTRFQEEKPERMYGWISDHNLRWNSYLYEKIDGAMSVLPEYDMAARPLLGERLKFTNLPIDISALPYSPLSTEGKIRIFIGLKEGMEMQKGTDRLLTIAREIEKEMPDKVLVEEARNLSLKEYLDRMSQSHIVLDQLYSYSPATNALQAMALGKIAASGAQPEYYDYIGNPAARPIIPLSPLDNDIKGTICKYIFDRDALAAMSREGRKLVETHNDVRTIADKFISHWERFGK